MHRKPAVKELSRQGTWRTYTTTDGLAGLQTEHIVEDRQGYLWFATCNSGVSRFDGDEFRTFTTRDGLCSDRVYAMCLDRRDRLWFGTMGGGLCWYDGAQFHQPPDNDAFADVFITYLFADREGRLWCGGWGALGYFDADLHYCDLLPLYYERYKSFKAQCRSITQDAAGDIWFGSRHPMRYDGSTFHRYDNVPGNPAGDLSGGGISTLGSDAAGDIWVNMLGQRATSLWRFDGESFTEIPLGFETGIRKFQLDRDGRLWGCTLGQGVFYIDDEPRIHRFTPEDGLAYGMVNHVHQDREGQYWFATWGGGISCYDPHSLHRFDRRDGIPGNEVAKLAEDGQGNIWMESSDAYMQRAQPLAVYDGQSFTQREWPFSHPDYLSSNMHTDDKGHVWLSISGRKKAALLHTDGHELRTLHIDESPDAAWITAITADTQDPFVVGRKSRSNDSAIQDAMLSLARYDGQHFHQLCSLERQLADVSSVRTDADRIRRVVMNLLGNALKFTERGSITVSLKPVDGEIELSVADTGSGIPPEDLPHIFDEFRQVEGQEGAKQEGTGLGLSIAKKSVELLGGTIEVESEVGEGTQFTLRLTDYRAATRSTAGRLVQR